MYLFLSDNPVGRFNLFLLEHFQKAEEDVVQLRKIKVVVVVFLLCQDLVEYLELLKHVFFKSEALLIYPLFHELLELLLEVRFVLAENANDFLPQLLYFLPKILLEPDFEVLELRTATGSDDELLQVLCPFNVLLQILELRVLFQVHQDFRLTGKDGVDGLLYFCDFLGADLLERRKLSLNEGLELIVVLDVAHQGKFLLCLISECNFPVMSGYGCFELATQFLKEGLLKSSIEPLSAEASKEADSLHDFAYLESIFRLQRKHFLDL